MADRVILHVGPHKTGSTALQNMFARNTGVLADFGIHYPAAGRDGAAQQDIARACWVEDSQILQDLTKEIETKRVVFISSELISGLEKTSLARLQAALPTSRVEIVYFLRRLPDLLASHWQELVKHGQWFTFEDYLQNKSLDHDRPSLRPPWPMTQLDRLRETFGEDSLRIMLYDARNTQNDDFGRDFADDVFGIGHEETLSTKRLNVTAPDWQVELGRHFNLIGRHDLAYPARLHLRQMVFALINSERPDWATGFAAEFDRATPLVLTDQTPRLAQEQAQVVETYGSAIVDPIDIYLAPAERHIRQLHPDTIDPALGRAINRSYRQLVAKLQDPS